MAQNFLEQLLVFSVDVFHWIREDLNSIGLMFLVFFYGKVIFFNENNKQYSGKGASSLSAIFLCLLAYFEEPIRAVTCFMAYLVFDLYLLRDTAVEAEIYFHHCMNFVLSGLGIYAMSTFTEEQKLIGGIIMKKMILMEFTTPLLHLGWILKDQYLDNAALLVYPLLMISWIYFRIYGPLEALQLISDLYTLPNSTELALKFLIASLIYLQVVWFVKLCSVGLKAWSKKNVNTEKDTDCVVEEESEIIEQIEKDNVSDCIGEACYENKAKMSTGENEAH